MCTCARLYMHTPQHVCGGQRTAWQEPALPSPRLGFGVETQVSGLAAGALTQSRVSGALEKMSFLFLFSHGKCF